MTSQETTYVSRRFVGLNRPEPNPANARGPRGVFWPPQPTRLGQGPRFEAFVRQSRSSLKTRRGVLLAAAKAKPCRVPLYALVDGAEVWPETFADLRENLREAEPRALNALDAYAMWTQTDILRVARALWEDFEESDFSHPTRRAEVLGARARERARIEERAECLRKRREEDAARRAADPDYAPYSPPTASKRDPLVSVEKWIELGAPRLDDILPLQQLTRNNANLMKYGADALAQCNQITAGEFLRRCVGRHDVPLKGWSIFAAQALDQIHGWTRAGKKRHKGSVAVVWRRDGAYGEFSLVEKPTARRRVM